MARDEVLMETVNGVARITLNRPHVLNAENLAWVDALERAAESAARDPDVEIVLVRGAGDAFCAGVDLDMLSREGMPPGFYATQERAFRALETMEKITIAAIHGWCLGGGLQLAIACDVRACAEDARLGLPALNEGLFPGMAVFRLPRLIGLGPARRLILSGARIDGPTALRIGLVDHVLPSRGFDHAVEELLTSYQDGPRRALLASKRLLAMAFENDFDDVYARSVPLLRDCLAAPEVAEAASAWRKRSRD